jgi:hypothetical protein
MPEPQGIAILVGFIAVTIASIAIVIVKNKKK